MSQHPTGIRTAKTIFFLMILQTHPQKSGDIIYSLQYSILPFKLCHFYFRLHIVHTVYALAVQMPVGCTNYSEL